MDGNGFNGLAQSRQLEKKNGSTFRHVHVIFDHLSRWKRLLKQSFRMSLQQYSSL